MNGTQRDRDNSPMHPIHNPPKPNLGPHPPPKAAFPPPTARPPPAHRPSHHARSVPTIEHPIAHPSNIGHRPYCPLTPPHATSGVYPTVHTARQKYIQHSYEFNTTHLFPRTVLYCTVLCTVSTIQFTVRLCGGITGAYWGLLLAVYCYSGAIMLLLLLPLLMGITG